MEVSSEDARNRTDNFPQKCEESEIINTFRKIDQSKDIQLQCEGEDVELIEFNALLDCNNVCPTADQSQNIRTDELCCNLFIKPNECDDAETAESKRKWIDSRDYCISQKWPELKANVDVAFCTLTIATIVRHVLLQKPKNVLKIQVFDPGKHCLML